MDIGEYQLYVNSFNKGKHKAYFLSCEWGLCNQLESFRPFKVFHPHTMGKRTTRIASLFIIFQIF